MGAFSGPETVDDGLVLAWDAAPNPRFSNYKGRSVAFVESNDDGFNVSNSTGWFNPNNTSQWTLEGWILNPSSTNKFSIYSGTNGSVANFGFAIGNVVSFQSGNGAWAWVTNSEIVADTGSPTGWNHFACTKNGSTFEVFLNGSRIYTGTPTFGTGTTGGSIHLQSYFSDGNYYQNAEGLSNVRYVTGSVLYSGTSYTVPTEPLTAISGTQLLVYQDTTFTDASSNSLTLTKQNSPTISYDGPFSGSGWTDLTNNGNSGTLTNGPVFTQEPKQEPFGGAGAVEFDGTGDYLTVPSSTDLEMGTGDFTVEMWVYSTDSSQDTQDRRFFATEANATSSIQIGHINTTAGIVEYADQGSLNVRVTGTTDIRNQWAHIAVVRNSGTVSLYVNGVSEGTPATDSNSKTASTPTIGKYPGASGHFKGFMSNLRVVKGTALYTSNFTPKRQPLLPESAPNTVLLTCQKGTIRDRSSSAHAITVNGDAHSIVGASYFKFDGTNDYIREDTILDTFTSISDPWSIECWFNTDVNPSVFECMIAFNYNLGNENTLLLGVRDDSGTCRVAFYYRHSNLGNYGTVTVGQWHHVAATHTSGGLKVYLDGTQIASNSNTVNRSLNLCAFLIGAELDGTNVLGNYFDGKISNVKMYNKGLTAAEVKQNYRNTKGRYGL